MKDLVLESNRSLDCVSVAAYPRELDTEGIMSLLGYFSSSPLKLCHFLIHYGIKA